MHIYFASVCPFLCVCLLGNATLFFGKRKLKVACLLTFLSSALSCTLSFSYVQETGASGSNEDWEDTHTRARAHARTHTNTQTDTKMGLMFLIRRLGGTAMGVNKVDKIDSTIK